MSICRIAGVLLIPVTLAGCSTVSSWLPGNSPPSGPSYTLGQAPGAVIATPPVQPSAAPVQTSAPRLPPVARPGGAMVAAPSTLTAVGYGSAGSYSQHSQGQQKLMAMRAAQVDAYRNLAEQVYGFRVIGNTAVSAFATQSDAIRSFVDSFMRGARVISTTAMADGNYEVTVELSLSHQFIDCVAQGGCVQQTPVPPTSASSTAKCSSMGCVDSSASYYSP